MVLQIVFAVGLHEPLLLGWIAAPFPEHHPKRNPDAGQTFGLASDRKTVGQAGVVKAVENQPDGVDEGAVEIEEDG